MKDFKKFEEYVVDFAFDLNLFNRDGLNVLALSGGIDSMALFYILIHQKISFKVLHFNHGLRPESKTEAEAIKKMCREHNIKLDLISLNLKNNHDKSFEYEARLLRLEKYHQYVKSGHNVILGHHLNDSFEWSMRQTYRQGSLRSTLGIPVFNRGIVRPLLCVSKKQIYNYQRSVGFNYFIDSTNNDLRFERNFLRTNLISTIEKKFPKYLKHYALQSNQLAQVLGLLRRRIKRNQLQVHPHFLTGVVLVSTDFEFHRDELFNEIIKLSNKKQGKISDVFLSLIRAQKTSMNDQTKKIIYGPFCFSGGVHGYLYGEKLWIYQIGNEEILIQYQADCIKKISNAQIPFGFNLKNPKFFPNINVCLNEEAKIKGQKMIFRPFSDLITFLKKSDIRYQYLSK